MPANRILRKLTGLESVYLKQSYAYGETDRDPGDRVISVAYFSLIAIRDINKKLAEENGVSWCPISRLPDLIFDHALNGQTGSCRSEEPGQNQTCRI